MLSSPVCPEPLIFVLNRLPARKLEATSPGILNSAVPHRFFAGTLPNIIGIDPIANAWSASAGGNREGAGSAGRRDAILGSDSCDPPTRRCVQGRFLILGMLVHVPTCPAASWSVSRFPGASLYLTEVLRFLCSSRVGVRRASSVGRIIPSNAREMGPQWVIERLCSAGSARSLTQQVRPQIGDAGRIEFGEFFVFLRMVVSDSIGTWAGRVPS